MSKETTVTLSTIISQPIKEALTEYCKRKGLKLRYFVENALTDKLEDEMDLEAYHLRKDEELFSLEDILASRK